MIILIREDLSLVWPHCLMKIISDTSQRCWNYCWIFLCDAFYGHLCDAFYGHLCNKNVSCLLSLWWQHVCAQHSSAKHSFCFIGFYYISGWNFFNFTFIDFLADFLTFSNWALHLFQTYKTEKHFKLGCTLAFILRKPLF